MEVRTETGYWFFFLPDGLKIQMSLSSKFSPTIKYSIDKSILMSFDINNTYPNCREVFKNINLLHLNTSLNIIKRLHHCEIDNNASQHH